MMMMKAKMVPTAFAVFGLVTGIFGFYTEISGAFLYISSSFYLQLSMTSFLAALYFHHAWKE